MTENNLDKPLFQLTLSEFVEVLKEVMERDDSPIVPTPAVSAQVSIGSDGKRYVYGIEGIARLFGCSKPTANRIKKSGKIDAAITQIGRKIVVDADMALELGGIKTGGRKH